MTARIKGGAAAIAVASGILALSATSSSAASVDAAAASARLCERAIARAEHLLALPEGLLLAVAQTEAGVMVDGRVVVWPWAANVEGQARYLPDRRSLAALLEDASRDDARPSIDVGCLQINTYWHTREAHPLRLVDPAQNALYAGRFLRDLHRRHGSWSRAVRAYHAGRPEARHGLGYACRVLARWARQRGVAGDDPACGTWRWKGRAAVRVAGPGE